MTNRTCMETADREAATPGYAKRFDGEVGRYFLDLQASLTLDLLKPYPGATVLDVGGGHAQLAKPLTENGFRVTVTGSDQSCRRMLDMQLPPGSFRFLVCDMLNLPFPDQSFEVVLAFRLISHVTRWPELIAELSRVAEKAVIIDYPDRRSINILSSLFFHWKVALEGNTRTFALFSKRQIAAEFARHGLQAPVFHHEFFLPMVLHRKMAAARTSRGIEQLCRICGLTGLFGSPAIVRAHRHGKRP